MKTSSTLTLKITLGTVILLLAVFSALQMRLPRVVYADAPATSFSAERAMADLHVVAREPHSVGSDAQGRVREYIIAQIEALGLKPEVETSSQVANILVRLPGYNPTKSVLVSGHYDSNMSAPGAGDDGISVVAMLESIRVLHARSTLRNDVLFLFTDGEEYGWSGARAFIHEHPEAKEETGMLLVFDARPGNAPLNLIKTSPGDAWLIRQMTGMPLALWAASWKNLQERNEMNTDYDIFQPAGYTGILIENEASGTRYHSSRDTVDAISPNLIQAYGQTMLALTHRFGSIDLRTRTESPDWAYFTLSLVGLVAYPYWVMVVLSSLGILAFLVFILITWQRAQLSIKRWLLSLSGLLVGIVLIVICAQIAWMVIKANQVAIVDGGFEGSAIWQAVLMGIAALLTIVLLYFLTRRLGWLHIATAAPIIYLVAGFTFNTITKTENPLTTAWLAWPFIGSVVGLGTLIFIKNSLWRIVILSLSALMILAVAVPRIWMAAYTREDAWLTVLVLSIWMGLFAPQVEAIFGRVLQD
jgi:hypothetical protein